MEEKLKQVQKIMMNTLQNKSNDIEKHLYLVILVKNDFLSSD